MLRGGRKLGELQYGAMQNAGGSGTGVCDMLPHFDPRDPQKGEN